MNSSYDPNTDIDWIGNGSIGYQTNDQCAQAWGIDAQPTKCWSICGDSNLYRFTSTIGY